MGTTGEEETLRLAGERALVTGSTSGIGRAVATRFAREGACVVVTGRDPERGRGVVREITDAGGRATFVPAELADESSVRALVDAAADAFDGLTVVVSSAASGRGDGSVEELTTQSWEEILRVNLTAPMWCARSAIPHLRAAGGGSIVHISTRQAERASRGHAAYIASKGGLQALTRALAVDYADAGIRANTISPGYVLNDRRDADLDAERRTRLEGMHLTRLATADDVALAAVYLASAESELLTGINLALDGGSSIARALTIG